MKPTLSRGVMQWNAPVSTTRPVSSRLLRFIALLASISPLGTHAATLTVNSISNIQNPGGVCTLRGAVAAMNAGTDGNGCINSAPGDAYGNNDKIILDPSLNGTIAFTLTANQLDITGTTPLVIAGQPVPGTPGGQVILDGGNLSRIFNVAGRSLTLQNLTLRNGRSTALGGGGIYTDHALIVDQCVFSSNSAVGGLHGGAINSVSTAVVEIHGSVFNGNSANLGGAINSADAVNIQLSTFIGNSATSGGGAVVSPIFSINQSTFSGNTAAGAGGAVFTDTATVTQSTFSSNSAGTRGGAIDTIDINLAQSTFNGNSAGTSGGAIDADNVTGFNLSLIDNGAPSGAGILVGFNASLNNSLFVSTGGLVGQCAGGTFSGSNNLGWRGAAADTSCSGQITTSYAGTAAGIVNPLNNNGGPTQTQGLAAGSPAIATGDSAYLLTYDLLGNQIAATEDQRGHTIPSGAIPDIGAYQSNAVASTPVPSAPPLEQKTHVVAQTIIGGPGEEAGSTIFIYFVPQAKDMGLMASVFVFAYLPSNIDMIPGSLWVLDSAQNWRLFTDCRATPAVYIGNLAVLSSIPVISMPVSLAGLEGTELYIGYGLGGYEAPSGNACNDMIARQNWLKVYTVPGN